MEYEITSFCNQNFLSFWDKNIINRAVNYLKMIQKNKIKTSENNLQILSLITKRFGKEII